MTAAAGPHEVLINEYLGESLYASRYEMEERASIKRVLITNKDLKARQFAYQIVFPTVVDAVAREMGAEDRER